MLKDRSTLVLYTTATCNLKCRYCYIDKNPTLKTIDKLLEDSFKGDYYFNFAKEIFPDPNQLKEIQIWGGEPSLGYNRSFYTIKKLINYYPNLTSFMTSTNFTTTDFFDQFYQFLSLFKDFPTRKFIFNLQLSLDGPDFINDISRGTGTTEKFKNNFDTFVKTINNNMPENVELFWHFKPTLDSGTIKILQTKEKIIEYFQFFETFYKQFLPCLTSNIKHGYSIPNTACPSPHTVEDGKLFANYCKLCREIEKENNNKHYFNFYKKITSFVPREMNYENYITYNIPGGICGTGRTTIGLLPNKMISACHNGFVDLITEYKVASNENLKKSNTTLDTVFFKDNRNIRMTMNVEEFKSYEQQIEQFYNIKTSTRLTNIATLINLLARVQQVDTKYLDRKEALKAAIFIQESTSYCIRDNINTTGSMSLYPVGLLKLLLNGAKEYIEND